jgi:hypothetical protein
MFLKMSWVREAYDEIWDNDFDKDEITGKLDKTDISSLKQLINDALKIINNHSSSVSAWSKFKFNLMKYNSKWKTDIFIWDSKQFKNVESPYVSVDIDLNPILNQRELFCIYLALEDGWMGPDIPSIWEIINPE